MQMGFSCSGQLIPLIGHSKDLAPLFQAIRKMTIQLAFDPNNRISFTCTSVTYFLIPSLSR
jgi:hypothetical protein